VYIWWECGARHRDEGWRRDRRSILRRLTNTNVSKQDWVWVGLVLFSEGTCVMVRCVDSLSLSKKGRCLICNEVTSSSVFDRVIKIRVQVVLQ
jgi:hypothetical protein